MGPTPRQKASDKFLTTTDQLRCLLPCAMENARRSVSVALALASLGSGLEPTFTRLFQMQFWNGWIWDGQHEAHFARRSGALRVPRGDRDNRFVAALNPRWSLA
jgi:hypothetical protein